MLNSLKPHAHIASDLEVERASLPQHVRVLNSAEAAAGAKKRKWGIWETGSLNWKQIH